MFEQLIGDSMFSYAQIEQLLSKQAAQLLITNSTLFETISNQAKEIIKTKVSINDTNPAEYLKQPFVWIVEYLLMTKYSGQSQETISMIKDRFEQALALLESYKQQHPTSSKYGVINDAYTI